MVEYITINGRAFRKCKHDNERVRRAWYEDRTGVDRDAIYKAYNRPSATKVSIWHSWCDWFDGIDGYGELHIRSHNCNFFTVSGEIACEETDWEYCPIEITYANHRIFM